VKDDQAAQKRAKELKKPTDVGWLKSIGFQPVETIPGRIDGYLLTDRFGRCAVSIGYRGQLLCFGQEVDVFPLTRGDVVDLCKALRVPILKPKKSKGTT